MQTLIELGADVNAKDLSTGKTPIMYTSDWREQEETKLLIKNNANIYLTDKNNKSCLDYLDEPNKKIVLCKDVLNGISNGNIEPNAKNSRGFNTCFAASYNSSHLLFIGLGTVSIQYLFIMLPSASTVFSKTPPLARIGFFA